MTDERKNTNDVLSKEAKERIRQITDIGNLNGLRQYIYARMKKVEFDYSVEIKGRRITADIQGVKCPATLSKFIMRCHEYEAILDTGETVRLKKKEFNW